MVQLTPASIIIKSNHRSVQSTSKPVAVPAMQKNPMRPSGRTDTNYGDKTGLIRYYR
jgi:hypothetical protein